MSYKILVVEDEPDINGLLVKILKEADYHTIQAFSGTEAKLLLEREIPDAILLDLMLPGMSGEELLHDIRGNQHNNVPVLVISAKDALSDKVSLLKEGADDYVTKPFSLAVLRARVNNLLRRGAVPRGEVVELPPFSFDFAGMAFSRNGEAIELSKTEQRLLRLLVEHRGQTLTREQLLDRVWDGGEFVDENALSVAVRRLRAKLGDAPIKTVYGLGYTWEIQ